MATSIWWAIKVPCLTQIRHVGKKEEAMKQERGREGVEEVGKERIQVAELEEVWRNRMRRSRRRRKIEKSRKTREGRMRNEGR